MVTKRKVRLTVQFWIDDGNLPDLPDDYLAKFAEPMFHRIHRLVKEQLEKAGAELVKVGPPGRGSWCRERVKMDD